MQIVVHRDDGGFQFLGKFDDLGVGVHIAVLPLHHLDGQELLQGFEHIQPAPSPIAFQEVLGVRDLGELGKNEGGNDVVGGQESAFDHLDDSAVDDGGCVENDGVGFGGLELKSVDHEFAHILAPEPNSDVAEHEIDHHHDDEFDPVDIDDDDGLKKECNEKSRDEPDTARDELDGIPLDKIGLDGVRKPDNEGDEGNRDEHEERGGDEHAPDAEQGVVGFTEIEHGKICQPLVQKVAEVDSERNGDEPDDSLDEFGQLDVQKRSPFGILEDNIDDTVGYDNDFLGRLALEQFLNLGDSENQFFSLLSLDSACNDELALDFAVELNGDFDFGFDERLLVDGGPALVEHRIAAADLLPKLLREVRGDRGDEEHEVAHAGAHERGIFLLFVVVLVQRVDKFHEPRDGSVEGKALHVRGHRLDTVVARVVEFLFRLSESLSVFGVLDLADVALHAVHKFGNRVDAVVAPRTALHVGESEHEVHTESIRTIDLDEIVRGDDVAFGFGHLLSVGT